jgi:hypothetical protein
MKRMMKISSILENITKTLSSCPSNLLKYTARLFHLSGWQPSVKKMRLCPKEPASHDVGLPVPGYVG